MLNHKVIAYRFLLLGGLALIGGGCGQKIPKDMPKTYPCKITVTKGGAAVEGVSILLSSPAYPGSLSVSGKTDASGVAEILSAYASYAVAGAPVGEATVTLQKTPEVPEKVRKPKEEVAKMTPPEQNAYAAEIAKAIAAIPKIVPQSLTSPATSPVKITVKEDQATTDFSVELDDYKK